MMAEAEGRHRVEIVFHYPRRDPNPDPTLCPGASIPNDLTDTQFEFVRRYFNKFEEILFGSDFEDPATGFHRYIDTMSFVEFFIITELMKNMDGYRISCFMYKDRNPAKLRMGPIWDLDLTLGNYSNYGGPSPEGWVVGAIPKEDLFQQPYWWGRLLHDSIRFKSLLYSRWQTLRADVIDADRIDAFIDATVASMAGAQHRNFEKWELLGTDPNLVPPFPSTYEEAIADMKAFLRARIAWMDGVIEAFRTLPAPLPPPALPLPGELPDTVPWPWP